ncbi:hypothetical protein D3C80_686150 [compost metagenome]
MSPPQLPRNVPICYIFHPVAVDIFEFRRMEFNGIIHDIIQGRFSQVFHFQEPLVRDLRFNNSTGSFRCSDIIGVVFYFFQQSFFFQFFFDLFTHFEAIHTSIMQAVVV